MCAAIEQRVVKKESEEQALFDVVGIGSIHPPPAR
jgi:hypothetical protein